MRMTRTLSILLSLSAFAACGSPSRNGNGDDDGSGSNTGVDGGNGNGNGDGGGGGGSNSNCSAASQFVYTVAEDNTMYKFDPATMVFTTVGTLDCSPDASPFSMGVDRNAAAYVLYDDGTLYSVPGLANGDLTCSQTAWQPTGDLTQFGMGFSTQTAGGTDDQLFIAGGDSVDTSDTASQPATLATVDVGSFTPTTVGSITGWPELTGTSAAELWGFFPDSAKPRIDKINKTSGGAATLSYSLKALKGDPTAWAFAAYGGDLWVFLEKDDETETTVYQIGGEADTAPGTVKGTTMAPGTIVGAGVSTCAPTIIM